MASRAAEGPLFESLGIAGRGLVSISGGGGKTSLAFHLCDELAAARRAALVTTTTKMFYPQAFPGAVLVGEDVGTVARTLREAEGAPVFAAACSAPEGKVRGFSPVALDELFARVADATILNEADGAAMKPYKFYRDDEPVLPASTTVHVHVIGCDALGGRMDESLVHRCPPELEGEPFDLERFEERAAWFSRTRRSRCGGRLVLVVNKADEGRERTAMEMLEAARPYFDACLATSLKEKRWHA